MVKVMSMSEIEDISGEDRISKLSDDLLVHILLFVPTRDAVATMFLSKRWQFVWRKLPRLEYKDNNVASKSVWLFLDNSMRFHDAPLLERLCIELGPHCPVDVDVAKWVAIAVERCIMRQLKFELRWNSKPAMMPKNLYSCKTLTKLTLSNKILVDVPWSVNLPSLIELELTCVFYKDEDAHVRLLLGCPILKNLKVFEPYNDNVKKFTVKVPSLLKLTIVNFIEGDEIDRSLVIDTPSLTYLRILDGELRHSSTIEYMPYLSLAYIFMASHPVNSFLRSLSSITYLILVPVSTMVPWCNVVYPLLEICSIHEFHPNWCESVLVLISNCPKLKVFEVISLSENHVSMLWNHPSSVPKCLSTHLEMFVWKGYAGGEVEKEFIRYILVSSECLKTVEIYLNSTCNLEEQHKMVEELEYMRRASKSLLLTLQIL